MLSIGTIQFAVNTEDRPEIIAEHPVGSISRMLAEILSDIFYYVGIKSSVAKLIISKPEEKTHKQLIYTSMLPIETAKKILEHEYFDYCLYGQIDFKELTEVEMSLLDSKNINNMWRRKITARNNDFYDFSIRILEEVNKILDLNLDTKKTEFLKKFSTGDLKTWGWYAVAFEEELSFEDKESALLKVIDLNDNFDDAKLKLVTLKLSEETKVKEGLDYLDSILDKLDIDLINYNAKILQKKEHFYEASVLYEYSLKKNPHQIQIYLDIIKTSFELRNYSKTKHFIKEYLASDFIKVVDFETIAQILLNMNDSTQALVVINKALEKNITSAKIYSMLAFIHMNNNDFSKASEYYEKSFNIAFNETVLEDWTACLLKIEKDQLIIDLVKKHRDDLIFNSGVECNLAVAYLNLNQKDNALAILESCVKKDKSNVKANALIGNLYFEQKSYSRAQKYLTIASKDDPNNPYWQKLLGDLFFETGDYQEAKKYYQKTLALNPSIKIHRALFINAEFLKKEKNYKEAIKKYYSSFVLDPQFKKALDSIADTFIETEELDNGIYFLENLLEKAGNLTNAGIWFNLHKLYDLKSTGFFGKKWKDKSNEALKKYNDYLTV